MSLWKIEVTQSVCFSGVQIECGMWVEITSRMYDKYNRLPICNNRDINEAFVRKYGVDLERAGLLSPNYLCATLVGEDAQKKDSGVTSLLAMAFDLLT